MPLPTPPSKTLTWATDTNYSNGPVTGTPTKVEPSTGQKAEGAIPTYKPPAQWDNWWKNLAYQWQAYFKSWIDASGFGTTVITSLDVGSPSMRLDSPLVFTGWDRSVASSRYRWEVLSPGEYLHFHLPLSPGSVLGVVVTRGLNADTDDTLLSYDITSFDLDGTETNNLGGGSWTHSGASDTETTTTHTLGSPITIDGTKSYYLRVTGGTLGDRFWGAYIVYTDPALRVA